MYIVWLVIDIECDNKKVNEFYRIMYIGRNLYDLISLIFLK